MYVGQLLVIGVPIAAVALAIWMNTRSRRDYGPAIVTAGILIFDVFGVIAVHQTAQPASASHTGNLEAGFVELIYYGVGLFLALALALGAIAETVIAHQWWWLAIIAGGVIVPAMVFVAHWTGRVPNVLGALGLSRRVESGVVVIAPVLVILAYAIDRIRRTGRPMKPARAHSR